MAADKSISLTKHLEGLKSRLQSGMIPERQASRKDAYKAWLKLEISRTEKKLSELKPVGAK
jgi:hypothetical protein